MLMESILVAKTLYGDTSLNLILLAPYFPETVYINVLRLLPEIFCMCLSSFVLTIMRAHSIPCSASSF